MQLIVSVTSACNLRCTHCPIDKENPNNLPIEAIKKLSTWDVSRIGILGGEPFLREDLPQIVDFFNDKPITIYTNGILLSEHPEKIIEGVHYAVSMDGMQENHDEMRGSGTWKKTYNALKVLSEKKDEGLIPSVWIRMTITEENSSDIKKIKKIADEFGIGVLYFPLLGIRTPFSPKFQLELFKWASTQENVSIYSPPFWQFCGYKKSSCQAGKWRLHVDVFGNVNPCQWFSETILGNIYTHDYDFLKKKGEEFYNEFITIKEECEDCVRKISCKGGCRLCPDSLTCPIKRRYFAQNVLDIDDIRLAETKHERMFGNLKIVVC